MGMSEWFGWNASSVPVADIPEIYPVPITLGDFVAIDLEAIYAKILTDVIERTGGLTEEQTSLLWDSCLKSEKPDGLITLLAKAMADKKKLFLVIEAGIIRLATQEEQRQIEADYKKQAKSSVGVFISFENYRRSDMLKFYLGVEYCTVGSLYKAMNLSKAIQIKISDLRKSVSVSDSDDAKTQAKNIAKALREGKDVMLDEKDTVETATPDLTATKAAIEFLAEKLSFFLGLPFSYISGEQTGGIGSTGEADMRAVERGLKNYYVSIVKPSLEALFSAKLTYKSQDFRQIESASDILKTFALIDDTMISADTKRQIVNRLLGLPEDTKADPPAKPAPAALPAPAQPPAQPKGNA